MGLLFHAVEEHYSETLIDLQELLLKTISLDSITIQHLITHIQKKFRHRTRKTKLLKVFLLHWGLFSDYNRKIRETKI